MKIIIKNLSKTLVANPFATFVILNCIFAVIIIMRIHSPADTVRERLSAKINTIEAESKKAKSQTDSLKKELKTTQTKLSEAIVLVAASELLNQSLTDTYYQHKKTKKADVDTIIAYLKLVQIQQKKLVK
jgi:hypothetical protein